MPFSERGKRSLGKLLHARVVRAFFKSVIHAVDDTVDVAAIRQTHRATKGRILRLRVGGIESDFRLTDKGIEEIPLSDVRPNATVIIDSAENVVNLLVGKVSVPQQDGTIETQVYDLQAAFWRGELRVESGPNEGWWSDMESLDRILKEILPMLRKRLGL